MVLCAYLAGFEKMIRIVSAIGPVIIVFTLVGSWRTLRPASLSLPLSIRQKNYYYDTTGKDEREGRKWRNRERAKETAVKNRA